MAFSRKQTRKIAEKIMIRRIKILEKNGAGSEAMETKNRLIRIKRRITEDAL